MPIKKMNEYFNKDVFLNLGEDMVRQIYKEVLRKAIVKIVEDSDNKFDDMIIPFLSQLDAVILPLIDKIDGEVG